MRVASVAELRRSGRNQVSAHLSADKCTNHGLGAFGSCRSPQTSADSTLRAACENKFAVWTKLLLQMETRVMLFRKLSQLARYVSTPDKI